MRATAAIAVAALLAWSGVALGQDSTVESNLPQTDQDGAFEGQSGPVGAGSSDAVTTGMSGPELLEAQDEPEVPPIPGEDLCADYAEQPFHEACLATVTSEGSVQ
jgi:hypothetical protein